MAGWTGDPKYYEETPCTYIRTRICWKVTDLYPDEITDNDAMWVYCGSRSGASKTTPRSGKWMLFIEPENIRECWDKIKQGILSNNIIYAKTLPASRITRGIYATMIYTYDHQDKQDVKRVLEYLYSVGLADRNKTIYYKTDQQTLDGIYSGGTELAWTYNSSDNFE